MMYVSVEMSLHPGKTDPSTGRPRRSIRPLPASIDDCPAITANHAEEAISLLSP